MFAAIGGPLFSARSAGGSNAYFSTRLVRGSQLSENKDVKKPFLIAVPLIAPLLAYAQAPTPSFPSGADAFSASPIPTASAAPRKIDSEKEKLIRALLARTKEAEMAEERVLQAMAGMKQLMPRVPEKYWEKYRSLISLEELQNRLVEVYDKHFTSEELNSLIQFYDSPIGRKLSEKTLPILRDSMEAAQRMSRRAGDAVASEMRAEQLFQQPRAAGSFGGTLAPGHPAKPTSPTATPTPTPQ
jgi:uncharacterized protein